jgi:hypothetical protein
MGASQELKVTLMRQDGSSETLDPNSIKEMRIVRKINSHDRIYLTGGRIKPEQKSDYLLKTDLQTRVTVDYKGDGAGSSPIFVGVVTRLELVFVPGDNYYSMQLKGASYSCLLDMMPHTRSFQDPDMLYSDLFKAVEAGYNGAAISTGVGLDNQKLQQFILQYQETDWGFLKRLASRFQTGLAPDPLAAKPALSVGLPGPGNAMKLSGPEILAVKKRVRYFQELNDGAPKDSSPEVQTYYKARIKKFLNTGQTAKMDGGPELYVYQSTAFIEKSEVYFEALLTPQNGMLQKPLYNKRLAGAALEGSVVKTGGGQNDSCKDKVQVQLNCDVLRPESEYSWFPVMTPYSAEANTGLYWLPEIDDFVNLYFPSSREEDAVVMGSLRETELDSQRMKELTTKYWRTPVEKQLALSPTELSLSGKGEDLHIKFSQTEGVVIGSPNQLVIHADGDLAMNASKNIGITASKTILLQCGKSSITLNGEANQKGKTVSGVTHIVGKKIQKAK